MKIMIVDIQGFNLPDFHPKEITFISGQQTAHYLLKPPVPTNTLNNQLRKQIKYLERFHHGLKYDSGYINYDMLDDILQKHLLNNNTDMVYVKGHQKQEFLENKLRELAESSSSSSIPTIINVEALVDVPNFIIDIPYCPNHLNHKSMCSLRNCAKLYNWLYSSLPK